MKREIKVTFEDVKNYIKKTNKYYVLEIIDSVEPFVMYYIKSPFGYAETDRLNDIDECTKHIDDLFLSFHLCNQREYNKMVDDTIKIETQRWKERNAWAYGRYIGRLAHLLNVSKSENFSV